MRDKLVLDELSKNIYHVYLNGVGIKMGEILMSEDGYYNFWPDLHRGGYWPSYILRMLADRVDEMNKPWDEEIQNLTNSEDMV